MCYLVAKIFDSHGCLAVQSEYGSFEEVSCEKDFISKVMSM